MTHHCCDSMQRALDFACTVHTDPFEWPNHLVFYEPKFDEYGIIVHDGGRSFVSISYCPWCGQELPRSKRDLWFETLRALGYDPFDEGIPEDFKSARWYRKQ